MRPIAARMRNAIERVKHQLGEASTARATEAQPARTELDRLRLLFAQMFGAEPDARAMETLRYVSTTTSALTDAQKLRRILASVDQQEYKTGFTVRWDAGDLMHATVAGVKLHLDQADISVSHPIASGAYEGHIISFFERFIKPGMTVVDAGANVGLYSMLAAKLVGDEGTVWSFEPNSENCRLLLASAHENGFSNIHLQPVALGNARGYTYFTSALGSNGGVLENAKRNLLHPSCKIVALAKLDDFGLEKVDLMKIDVEGAEATLIRGAKQTLKRCRPAITMEFSHEMLGRISGVSGGDFLEELRAQGYAVNLLDKTTFELRPIADVRAFDRKFEGTGRIEDLVLLPA